MNTSKQAMIEKLQQQFEPELAHEIVDLHIQHVAAETVIEHHGYVQAVPMVINGSITVKQMGDDNEVKIYDLNSFDSCIVSITGCFNPQERHGRMQVNVDSDFLLITPELIRKWMDKYPSWRKYVINLYNSRLNELIEQHQVVHKQRNEIQKQQEDLTDSIQYARRIQTALMPPDELVASLLPEHFILSKPRNIVSGDYYWISSLGNKTVVAVADCTGHGVPGAFMSMLGMSFLEEIVNRNQLMEANQILNKMRETLKKSLRQTGKDNENKDGMDISLCIFDFENRHLQFAGAYNPLCMVRDGSMMQVKADRMPIGIYLKERESFTNNDVDLQPGDVVYMFSDGYADQFGGSDNRKFMFRNFSDLLVNIHKQPMHVQKQILDSTIEQWRGNHEQVDDITVMGIRIA